MGYKNAYRFMMDIYDSWNIEEFSFWLGLVILSFKFHNQCSTCSGKALTIYPIEK